MTGEPMNTSSLQRRWLPELRSRWWSLVLGLSLMLNLLVGGIAVGHIWRGGPPERLAGASYVQLIPRKFFFELPSDRRREFLDILKANRDDFRALRKSSEQTGLKLADDLEKTPFSIDDVRATISAFATGSESLAAKGGSVVVEIVSKLTPDERQALAEAIRERASKDDDHHKKD